MKSIALATCFSLLALWGEFVFGWVQTRAEREMGQGDVTSAVGGETTLVEYDLRDGPGNRSRRSEFLDLDARGLAQSAEREVRRGSAALAFGAGDARGRVELARELRERSGAAGDAEPEHARLARARERTEAREHDLERRERRELRPRARDQPVDAALPALAQELQGQVVVLRRHPADIARHRAAQLLDCCDGAAAHFVGQRDGEKRAHAVAHCRASLVLTRRGKVSALIGRPSKRLRIQSSAS